MFIQLGQFLGHSLVTPTLGRSRQTGSRRSAKAAAKGTTGATAGRHQSASSSLTAGAQLGISEFGPFGLCQGLIQLAAILRFLAVAPAQLIFGHGLIFGQSAFIFNLQAKASRLFLHRFARFGLGLAPDQLLIRLQVFFFAILEQRLGVVARLASANAIGLFYLLLHCQGHRGRFLRRFRVGGLLHGLFHLWSWWWRKSARGSCAGALLHSSGTGYGHCPSTQSSVIQPGRRRDARQCGWPVG